MYCRARAQWQKVLARRAASDEAIRRRIHASCLRCLAFLFRSVHCLCEPSVEVEQTSEGQDARRDGETEGNDAKHRERLVDLCVDAVLLRPDPPELPAKVESSATQTHHEEQHAALELTSDRPSRKGEQEEGEGRRDNGQDLLDWVGCEYDEDEL